MGSIAESFEPAEVSAIKDLVMDELHDVVVEANGDDEADGPYDAITLADQIVEKLIAAGVRIPESLVVSIEPLNGRSE